MWEECSSDLDGCPRGEVKAEEEVLVPHTNHKHITVLGGLMLCHCLL